MKKLLWCHCHRKQLTCLSVPSSTRIEQPDNQPPQRLCGRSRHRPLSLMGKPRRPRDPLDERPRTSRSLAIFLSKCYPMQRKWSDKVGRARGDEMEMRRGVGWATVGDGGDGDGGDGGDAGPAPFPFFHDCQSSQPPPSPRGLLRWARRAPRPETKAEKPGCRRLLP